MRQTIIVLLFIALFILFILYFYKIREGNLNISLDSTGNPVISVTTGSGTDSGTNTSSGSASGTSSDSSSGSASGTNSGSGLASGTNSGTGLVSGTSSDSASGTGSVSGIGLPVTNNQIQKCTDNFNLLIDQVYNEMPITATIDPECNSSYYNKIKKFLDKIINLRSNTTTTTTTPIPTSTYTTVTCPTVTTPTPTTPPCPTPAPIKCVADFGTNIGDSLSGGQGVLQDTRYICPNTLKKCSHFKCGSAFGTCTA